MNLTKMSDSKLLELAKDLHCSIYQAECFSSRDALLYEKALSALRRRGFVVHHSSKLKVTR